MDHQKVYDHLIQKAVLRENMNGYFERHHIIPKCLGGSDDKNNLVKLTAREHFIAHCLLARIHGGVLWHAIIQFKDSNRYFSSRLYENARKKHAIEISKRLKNIPRPAQSIRQKGVKRPDVSIQMRGNTYGNNLKGYKHSPEFGKAISIRQKGKNNPMFGKKLTPEHKLKIAASIAKNRFDRKCIAINTLINSIFI